MFKRTRTRNEPPQPEEYPEQDVAQEIAQSMGAQKKVEEVLGDSQTPFAEFMLEDKSIPEPLRALFPIFADKEFALTNLTPDQVWEFKLRFRNSVLNYYLLTPECEQTAEINMWIDQMEAKFLAKILRSTGGMARERALYNTTITATERPEVKQVKGGIFSRIAKKIA